MKTVLYVTGLMIGALCGFETSTMIALVGIAIISYLDEISGKVGGK